MEGICVDIVPLITRHLCVRDVINLSVCSKTCYRLFGLIVESEWNSLLELLKELNTVVANQGGSKRLKVAKPATREEATLLARKKVVDAGFPDLVDRVESKSDSLDTALFKRLFINKPLRPNSFLSEFYDTSRFPILCQVLALYNVAYERMCVSNHSSRAKDIAKGTLCLP